jgi:hypothetical protein
MSRNIFSYTTSLSEGLSFLRTSGRDFTAEILLPEYGVVRLYAEPHGFENVYALRVIADDGSELASTHVANNTTSIFRSLGLLVHFSTE